MHIATIFGGRRIYDVPAIAIGPLTDVTFTATTPALITRASGSWITDGFRVGYKIKALGAAQADNNNQQWTIDILTDTVITLVSGDTVTAESAGASVTFNTMNYINLDFRTATEAWLLDGLKWLPLTGGIQASQFTISTQTVPTRFEFREYFEISPEPEKSYIAWIKGHKGLMDFKSDNDISTIDPEVILLKALIWGKTHFKDKDGANLYKDELNGWLGTLNGALFAGLRFVPQGPVPERIPFSYPQVTFPRT